MRVVDLSEGCVPKRLEMNGKTQHAQPLQVVNLSEGCSPQKWRGVWVSGDFFIFLVLLD